MQDVKFYNAIFFFNSLARSGFYCPDVTFYWPQAIGPSLLSSPEYVFSVYGEACPKHPRTSILLNDMQVKVLIDSGAAVNIISENIDNMLWPQPEMKVANIKIFSYGSKHALPIMSVFECSVNAKDRNTQATFYVLKGSGHSFEL